MNYHLRLAGHIGDWIFALLGILLTLTAISLAFFYHETGATPERSDEVAEFVTDFGKNLESVPVSGPAEAAASAMDALYAPYVLPDLLASWKSDPANAPGRTTSNPRTVGIRVSSVQNVGPGTYVVKGYLIEETKTGTTTDESDGQGIILGVIRIGDEWKIVEYQKRTGS